MSHPANVSVAVRAGLLLLAFLTIAVVSGGAQDVRDPGPTDLSVCSVKPTVYPTENASVREFAARLHGTWLLNTRTIEGLTIDTDSRLYFDFDTVSDKEATGRALMLDKGNLSVLDPLNGCRACEADAAMGALWEVHVANVDDERIVLKMAGDYLGSYGDFRKGVRATEAAAFVKNGTNYLSGHLVSPAGGQGMPDDVWDRIGLSGDTLTYISCTGGFVDRFEKLSSEKPDVDGLSLADAWVKAKKDGWLLKPPPVHRGIGRSTIPE